MRIVVRQQTVLVDFMGKERMGMQMKKKNLGELLYKAGALLLSTCLFVGAVPKTAYASQESSLPDASAAVEGSVLEERKEKGEAEVEFTYKPFEEAGYSLKYIVDESGITLTGYINSNVDRLVLPSKIDGVEVVAIGEGAFQGCSGFSGELVLPESLISIGADAFSNCSGLTGSLQIPETVTSIGEGAFAYCSGLTGALTLPKGVSSIGKETFMNCSGLNGGLTIPEGVATIGESAFYRCSGLKGDLSIPDSVTRIGTRAFYDCSGFDGRLVLSSAITQIEDYAFYRCSRLKGNLAIPVSVEQIGNHAFYQCSGFNGSLVIREGVKRIGNYAFYKCSSLTGDLRIPNSVTELGYYAFADCSGLNGSLTLSNCLTALASGVFLGCSGLRGNLILPESVTVIAHHAFAYCSSLTGNLQIPGSVTEIGNNAFRECSGFDGVLILPEGLTKLENGVFFQCSGLRGKLVLPESITAIENYAFHECSGLSGDLVIPERVSSIGPSAFYGCSGFDGVLKIPKNVTSLANSVFSGCSGFTGELMIPEQITTIEEAAFQNCTGFCGDLVIPEEVEVIGARAFYGCNGLSGNVKLRDTIYEIGEKAFIRCDESGRETAGVIYSSDASYAQSYAKVNGYSFVEWCWDDMAVDLTAIRLDTTIFSVGKEGRLRVSFTPENATYKALKWSSSDEKVIAVENGHFEALQEGQAALTATAQNGVSVSQKVQVVTMQLDKPEMTLVAGQEGKLTVNLTPAINEKSSIIWSSSDESVATVAGGRVTALKQGLVTITAQIADSAAEASCQLAVLEKEGELSTAYRPEGSQFDLQCVIREEGVTITGHTMPYASAHALVLPDTIYGMPVVSIGDNAFSGGTFTGELMLPEGLVTIGEAAFYNCDGFTGDLILPWTVLHIGNRAFDSCDGFQGKLILSESLESIGEWAFSGLHVTGELVIPDSVVSIAAAAFFGCDALTGDLIFPKNITVIEDNVFTNCKGLNGELVLPDRLERIGKSAFHSCIGLTGALQLPKSVTDIGEYAFAGCKGFTGDLVIPDGITDISSNAFLGCSGLDGELVLPATVTRIGEGAFSGCQNLSGNLVLPAGIKEIGATAFISCSRFMGRLRIPEGVVSIGQYAFSGCKGFTGDLVIPDGITNISYGMFSGCSGLDGELVLPQTVTRIEDYAFNGCTGFCGELFLPKNITLIGDGAFSWDTGFEGSLKLPEQLRYIGSHAFEYCEFVGGLILPKKLEYIGSYAFSRLDGLTGDLVIPASVTYIGENAFNYCRGLKGDLIIKGDTEIAKRAFYYCDGFAGDLIIEGAAHIGEETFCYCDGFAGDLIIEGAAHIGEEAFYYCNSFAGDLIVKGNAAFDEKAFINCNAAFRDLRLEGIKEIGANVFARADRFTGIRFTGELFLGKVETIGDKAFWGQSELTGELVLPKSIVHIGEQAFGGCTSLGDGLVIIPSSIRTIARDAFTGHSYGSNMDAVAIIQKEDGYELTGSYTVLNDLRTLPQSNQRYYYLLSDGAALIKDVRTSDSQLVFDTSIEADKYKNITRIAAHAFEDCTHYTGELLLPETLQEIDAYAFAGCTGFTGDLVIPSGVEKIGYAAFQGCNGLSGVVKIPRTVTEIADRAFEWYDENGNQVPIAIYAPLDSAAAAYAKEKGYVFVEWAGFDWITADVKGGLEIVGYQGSIQGELVIPEKIDGVPVVRIGAGAFKDTTTIEGDLLIPDSITSIGAEAFWNCSGLNGHMVIPETVTEIGENALELFVEDETVLETEEMPVLTADASEWDWTLYPREHIYARTNSAAHLYAINKEYEFTEWNRKNLNAQSFPTTFDKEMIVPANEFWILVMDETATPITDAILEVTRDGAAFTDYTYQDGVIKMSAAGSELSIKAVKYGKVTSARIFDVQNGGKDYIKMEENIKNASIVSVIYKTEGKKGYALTRDVMRTSLSIPYEGNGETVLTVNTGGLQPDTYVLLQGSYKLAESDTKEITLKHSDLRLKGGDVYVKTMRNGKELSRRKLHISVNRTGVSDGDFKLGGEGFSVTLDESIPFFGGSEFSMDSLIKLPVRIEEEDGKVKVYVGDAYNLLEGIKKESKVKKLEALQKEFTQKKIDAAVSSVLKKPTIAGMDVSVKAAGYGEATAVNSGGGQEIQVGIYVKITASNGATWYTFIGPVPVYAEINGELEGSVNKSISMKIKNGKLNSAQADVDHTISGKLQLGAGVGLNDFACIEVNGSGKLEWEHKKVYKEALKAPVYEDMVQFTADASAKAILLFLSYEKNIAKATWELWPNQKLVSAETVWDALDVLQASEYQVLTRDYLMEADLIGREMDVLQSNGIVGAEAQVIVNGLYPDAKPCLVSFNGVQYLFYLDDLVQRGVEDKSALVYRRKTENGWSDAAVVYEDGTADFDFEAAAGNDGIYVVWQNAGRTMTGTEALDEAAAALELQAARVTEDGVTMLQTPDTTEGLAPLKPSVVCSGNTVWAGWYENSANELLNNDVGRNVFYAQTLGTEGKGERTVLAETSLGVATVDFGILGDAICCAYTEDTDHDMNTAEDREVYLVLNGEARRLTDNETVDSNPQFGVIGGNQVLVYYSESNFVCTDGNQKTNIFNQADSSISDSFLFVSNTDKPVILWEDSYISGEDAGQALTATYYENGSWKEPFRAASTSDALIAFTAGAKDSSDETVVDLVFTVRGELDGQEITRMYQVDAQGRGVASLTEVEYEESNFEPGAEFPMSITVGNETAYPVSAMEVIIRNAAGAEVFSQSVEEVLEAGAEKTITVSGFVSEDTKDAANYTLFLYSDGRLCGTHDFTLGSAMFVLADEITYDGEEEMLNLKLTNAAKFAEDVKLTILSQEDGALLVEKVYQKLPAGCSANYLCTLAGLWEQTDSRALVIKAESLGRQEADLYDNEVVIFNVKALTADAEEGTTAEEAETVQVKLSRSSVSLETGETFQLTADVTPEETVDKTVVWYSNNENFVTVDENGLVTAVGAGLATIRAYTAEGVMDTCKVAVKEPVIDVTGVELNETQLSLQEGEKSQLWAVITPDDATDKTITWNSSNEEVVVVNGGMVKALGVGTATVTAVSANRKRTVCTVTVTERPAQTVEVTEIVLDKSEMTLEEGAEGELQAVITPADATDKTLTWSSSNEEVATAADGKVKAVKAGTATITAASANGVQGSCLVTVTAPQEEVQFADVPVDSWKYSAAVYVYKRGVMTGKGVNADGVVFAPDDLLTRQELAQMLYSAEGKPEVAYTERFSDVKDGQWYTSAVLWAAENGIVSGYPNGKYGVDDKITREQLAAMLYKYAVYKGYDTTARAEVDRFEDADKISSWAIQQLQWAVANGVMSGKGKNLDPIGSATRAECAAMLRSFMVKFETE